MNRTQALEIALFVATIVLLANSVAISRDYQDSWTLEGLEFSFALFVVIYLATFLSEKKNSRMIALAVLGRAVFFLIPNLKYTWFQGIWIDQHVQYALATNVLKNGHIITRGPFNMSIYGNVPFIHLTFAIFSMVLNIPVVASMKYLPVLLSSIDPLLIYAITKKLNFSEGTTIMKYALLISSLPIVAEYVITGSSFGAMLVFLVLSSLIALIHNNDKRSVGILIFFIFILAASHSSSSVLLAVFLLAITLFQKFSYFRLSSIKYSIVLIAMSISAAWLMFPAGFTFEKIVHVSFMGATGGVTPGSEQIPLRFFDLIRINLFEAIKSAIVYGGADIILLPMTFVGLIILLKMLKRLNNASKFLIVFELAVLLFLPLGFLLRVGLFRILGFAELFFPIFASFVITYYLKRKNWIIPIVLLAIVFLGTIQFYFCQPIVPSANVLSSSLPENEPLVYVQEVNSVYQRQMINFAQNHVTGLIASDFVTGNQIVGLTDVDFVVKHIGWSRYYPLDKSQLKVEYNYFLIHLPGISGGFGEQAEIRSEQVIVQVVYNSSVIYTNGESFILTPPI